MGIITGASITCFGVNAVSIELWNNSAYVKRYIYIDGNGFNPPNNLSKQTSLWTYTNAINAPALEGASTPDMANFNPAQYINSIKIPKTDIAYNNSIVFVCQVVQVTWEGQCLCPQNASANSVNTTSAYHIYSPTSESPFIAFNAATNSSAESQKSACGIYNKFSFPVYVGNTGNASVELNLIASLS